MFRNVENNKGRKGTCDTDLTKEKEKKLQNFFTKDSIVVIKNIVDALESKKPKPRYYNTFATHLLGGFKRVLSTSFLDKILRKI